MADNNLGAYYGHNTVVYVDAENPREAAILETMGHRQGVEFILSLRAAKAGDTREPSQIISDIPLTRPSFKNRFYDALHKRFPAKALER